MVLRWLLERSLGCTGCMVTSVLTWPVFWFLAMVALAQVSLWVALAIMKLTRLPMRHYDVLACGITLTALSAVAWEEYSGGCPVGWWLGVLWFVGLVVALLGGLFRPTK